jgi:ATP-dependent DNA helicase RecG
MPGSGRTLGFLANIPVGELKNVGPKRGEALFDLGIETVFDLLTHYPRRYVDRTRQVAVAEMALGEEALILAEVRRVQSRRTRHGRALVELEVDDGTGALQVSFFNQAWRAKQLSVGTEALFFGKLDSFRGRPRLTNPVVDLVGNRTGRIVPVYPASEKSGVTGWDLGEWVEEALDRAGPFADPLPEEWRATLDLVDRTTAFRGIHLPDTIAQSVSARRRLAFDELLRLQLEVVMRRKALEREARGIRHVVEPDTLGVDLVGSFLAALPFPLTRAQSRAIAEIRSDLGGVLPMHRLLQGDVGSGKTVVALATLLVAAQGGYQGALMAPTEVLAEQHYIGVHRALAELRVPDPATLEGGRPLRVVLLTSRSHGKERARLLEEVAAGHVDLVVGTHALLTPEVRFAALGVVVIDEQHRFGVEQRAALRAKGREGAGGDPDLLVMTATPIPRTAAMVVFGDLDVTVLDELPPGRAPIRTTWCRDEKAEAKAWEKVRGEVAHGHRAYVVCPLVEGSERLEVTSVTEELDRLAAGPLAGLRLGLLHGQLKHVEKETVMDQFRHGVLDVLVATTVIEVGVDVPEATVMVIEDADRFGIAQLHQLRGRVGRGTNASWCFLFGKASTPEAVQRLEAMERSTDGFELAEVDLDLRGAGAILGTRQKGRTDLKLASLRRGDRPLVEDARRVALSLLEEDPTLTRHPLLAGEIGLFLGEEEAGFLLKS